MIRSSQPTADRVMDHTPPEVNEHIEMIMRTRLRDLAGRLEEIEDRLHQIDHEWDIERTLEANAATITLVSLVLGSRWRLFHYLPLVVAGFLLQHAIQGWCPPVSIFRRMGVRTMKEIDRERYALKALRGDFRDIPEQGDPDDRVSASLRAAEYEAGQ